MDESFIAQTEQRKGDGPVSSIQAPEREARAEPEPPATASVARSSDSPTGSPPSAGGRKAMAWAIGGLSGLVVLLAIGIAPRVKRNSALAQSAAEAKSSIPQVETISPSLVNEGALSLPGDIDAFKEATINARSTGYVRRIFVDIGAHVKAGQILAQVQAPDLDQQKDQAVAQTVQSRAVVSASQVDVVRQQAGLWQNQADVEKQRATVQQAQAQVTSAVAAYNQALAVERQAQAGVAHAQQQLGVSQSALTLAQAQRDLAQATYTRYETLYKQGFAAAQDVDTQAAGLKTATASVASAQSGVSSAQADVTSAQQALNAATASAAAAAANIDASRKNVSANQAALTSTVAAVRYARQNIAFSAATMQANRAAVNASQANQQRYQVMQGFENVVAPFDGVITSRNVDAGTLVVADSNNGVLGSPSTSSASTSSGMPTTTPSTGMFGIARTDRVRIDVSVPQTYVPTLRAGSTAEVTVAEIPGQIFRGMVTLRSGALDTASRTQLIEIILPNERQELVPGMYANVDISPVHPLMTLRIPGTALIADSDGTRVAQVTRAGTVRFVPVTVGRDFGTEMEITSGLAGRERLIDNPSDLLQDGMKVKAVKSTRPRKKHAPGVGKTKGAAGAAPHRSRAGAPRSAAPATVQ